MKKSLNFAVIGHGILRRAMQAIKDLGHRLVVGYDRSDSVGIIDSISPEAYFFTEFELFIDFCHEMSKSPENSIDYMLYVRRITFTAPIFQQGYVLVAMLFVKTSCSFRQ